MERLTKAEIEELERLAQRTDYTPEAAMTHTPRIALYMRISKKDSRQTVENQFVAMEQACAAKGWNIVLRDHDKDSGSKRDRKGLERILAAAENRQFDILMVWALDRFTREGAFRALELIQHLDNLGIAFCSLREPHFDTSGPFKDALIAISATLAKMERERMIERINAGIERSLFTQAKAAAKKLFGHDAAAFITQDDPRYHVKVEKGQWAGTYSGTSWDEVFSPFGVRGPRHGKVGFKDKIRDKVLALHAQGYDPVRIAASIQVGYRNGKRVNPCKRTIQDIIKKHAAA